MAMAKLYTNTQEWAANWQERLRQQLEILGIKDAAKIAAVYLEDSPWSVEDGDDPAETAARIAKYLADGTFFPYAPEELRWLLDD